MSTYDAARQRVVLFGGGTVGGGSLQNNTWEWDGSAWQQITTAAAPLARFRGGLAYDAVRRRCLLFGGFTPFRNDTWSYDGSNWTQLAPATVPAARDAFGFEYDPDRRCIYMFGGDGSGTSLNDSWRYCSRGEVRAFNTGCTGSGAAVPTLSAPPPAIGSPWTLSMQTTVPNSSALLIFGGSSTTWNGAPLPLDLTVLGFTGCRLLVSLDISLFASADATGVAALPVPLPALITLVGATFYNQGVNANLGFTAGLAVTVGH